jgi:hypothetical protein
MDPNSDESRGQFICDKIIMSSPLGKNTRTNLYRELSSPALIKKAIVAFETKQSNPIVK